MRVTKEEVKKIAALSRLHILEESIEEFAHTFAYVYNM